jgi:hypothetical protein
LRKTVTYLIKKFPVPTERATISNLGKIMQWYRYVLVLKIMHEIYINFVYLIIHNYITWQKMWESLVVFRSHYGVREQTSLENTALNDKNCCVNFRWRISESDFEMES